MSENKKPKPKFTARIVRAAAAGLVMGSVLAALFSAAPASGFTPASGFVIGQAAAQAIELSKDLET